MIATQTNADILRRRAEALKIAGYNEQFFDVLLRVANELDVRYAADGDPERMLTTMVADIRKLRQSLQGLSLLITRSMMPADVKRGLLGAISAMFAAVKEVRNYPMILSLKLEVVEPRAKLEQRISDLLDGYYAQPEVQRQLAEYLAKSGIGAGGS